MNRVLWNKIPIVLGFQNSSTHKLVSSRLLASCFSRCNNFQALKYSKCELLRHNEVSIGTEEYSRRISSSSKFANRSSKENNGLGHSEAFASADVSKSLSEAVAEELNLISSAGQGDNEISFPGNWAIQKLGARVVMTSKTPHDKSGAQVRVSFSVNQTEDEEEDDDVDIEEETEDGASSVSEDSNSQQSRSSQFEDGSDPELFETETEAVVPSAISIEIRKNNKIMHLEAAIFEDGPILKSVSFNRTKSQSHTSPSEDYEAYEINFYDLSESLQDAIHNYLQELGLNEEFFAHLQDWALNYEHSLFVGMLNEMKNFSADH